MKKEYEALYKALDPENLDIDEARRLATSIVKKYPDEFNEYAGLTDDPDTPDDEALSAIVADIDHFRAQGRTESWMRAEAWHLHIFEPQNIGGSAGPHRRDHGKEDVVPVKRRVHTN